MLEESDTPFPPVPEEDEEEEEEEEVKQAPKDKSQVIQRQEEDKPKPKDSIEESEELVEEDVSTSEAVTTIEATTRGAHLDDNDDPNDDCPTDSAPFPISSSTGSEEDPSTGPSTAENSQSQALPVVSEPEPNIPEELDPNQLAKLKSLKESNA